jgi:PAS domain S-box-containing protein
VPPVDYATLSKDELIARLQSLERERANFEEEHLGTIKELRDVKAALDEHSIVAITDATGKITYVNDKFCAISKYSRDELMGQDHRIINSRYHSKEFFHDLWATIGQGRVWQGEIRNRAKDGSIYWVDTTIYPFVGPNGKPVQYVAIRTDITQRKADEAELERFASDLAEKNKELEAIVYTVSHDLRSPLVNVQGFGKQLQRACEKIKAAVAVAPDGNVPAAALKQPLEEAIPQALRFINAGVNKMEMLLAGLLRYSRLGRLALTIGPVDMNALVVAAIAAMKFQLEEAKAEVHAQQLPGCLGDNGQLSQVFANLIDNALKYRDVSRPLRVTISGRIENGNAIYRVTDNGIGLGARERGKVGSFGLVGIEERISILEGAFSINSTDGEGTTVCVSVPLHADPTRGAAHGQPAATTARSVFV